MTLDACFIREVLGGMNRVEALPCLVPLPGTWGFNFQCNRKGTRKVRRVLRDWHRTLLLRLIHGGCKALVLEGDLVLTREAFVTALAARQVLTKGGGAA
ncbi:hypothetical protein [Myxococcus eversor]|uniref:hypothetical protein n=1 Tax=Myxococcus eversor TaxID=2709661 RepID=UPI0013D88FE4|nr:hypothetical protein [Myxococcus eversor]